MAFVFLDDYRYASLVAFEFIASNMSKGWFMLLTSFLGFYRVKRWERQILSSNSPSNTAQPTLNIVSQLESNVSLRGMSRIDLVRQGFGIGIRSSGEELASGAVAQPEGNERDPMLVTRTEDPEQAGAIASVLESDARLRRQLIEAGFL